MINKNIFVLVKPTHECNLKCEYCYDAKEKKVIKNKLITNDIIDSFSKKLFNGYESVRWVWHGGEPLTVDSKNYFKWHNIISKNKTHNTKEVSFGMQSNGILFDKEKEKMTKELDIGISFSYDGTNNNSKRNNKTNEKINSTDYGKINVIDYESSFNMIEKYEENKKNNDMVNFNKIFLDKKTDDNIEQYTKNWIKYFEHYLFDTNSTVKDVMFFSIFNSIFGIKEERLCTHENCLNSFISMNPDGDIFPCDRFGNCNGKKYSFGNIKDYIYTVSEYKLSNGYENYISDYAESKKNCRECDISIWCEGGCVANRVHNEIIDISKLNKADCIFHKMTFKYIFNRIFNLSFDELLNINNIVYRTIFDEKIILKILIDRIEKENIERKLI